MKIAIVGAGTGGKKLIELFHQMDEVEIKTVVDRNQQSQGVLLAKQLGINCVMDLTQIASEVDLIIEATGSENVLNTLMEQYGKKKRIIQSDVAALLMTVVDQQTKITDRLNYQLEQITETSDKLHKEMDYILSVTGELLDINKQLVNASEESKKFILQTDEMTKAVNKITQQIKILGLNANIEAARAGEHGKGFSVVATEVQKMSDTTSTFAGQIAELLQSLGLENERITMEVSKLNRIASEQEKTTAQMKEIVNVLNQI
ncbi:methyl-accepting chemotaxis protein [Fusibacter ferrireducens]|uniref:Gfo/Idh/MocA family oxidoreductase n=1 Tax=Fusibacter ferrireducens TaxID=2785058 RepID=A0ABR9ZTU7_9FIRM|nr:methyl-accepting chemotaxis protein [Fusibacter ferrireducens]MBF4693863.1 Gfo/Idh/MocA family oxidoreductase [Fusibacter ferrireducens]